MAVVKKISSSKEDVVGAAGERERGREREWERELPAVGGAGGRPDLEIERLRGTA